MDTFKELEEIVERFNSLEENSFEKLTLTFKYVLALKKALEEARDMVEENEKSHDRFLARIRQPLDMEKDRNNYLSSLKEK